MRELLGVVGVARRRAYDAAQDADAAHLDQHQHVGHPVLERLEGADRPAELHPGPAVVDRHLQRPAGQPGLRARPRRRRRPARPGRGRRAPSPIRVPPAGVDVTRTGWSGPSRAASSGHSTPGRPRSRSVAARRRAGRWPGRRTSAGPSSRANAATSPAAIRGSSRCLASSSAPASSASAVTSEASRGDGRERAAELLERDQRLEEREPGAVVLLRDGQRGHADLLAEQLPQRLVVPVSDSAAARTAALSARLASSERTVDASSCCSSVNANSISRTSSSRSRARWYAGVPQAPTSARTLVSQMLRSNSAV